MQQAHPRTSSRRKRVALLLALSIGALALAALPPAPSSGVPARASALEPAAVAEDASSSATADTEAATSIPSSSPAIAGTGHTRHQIRPRSRGCRRP